MRICACRSLPPHATPRMCGLAATARGWFSSQLARLPMMWHGGVFRRRLCHARLPPVVHGARRRRTLRAAAFLAHRANSGARSTMPAGPIPFPLHTRLMKSSTCSACCARMGTRAQSGIGPLSANTPGVVSCIAGRRGGATRVALDIRAVCPRKAVCGERCGGLRSGGSEVCKNCITV